MKIARTQLDMLKCASEEAGRSKAEAATIVDQLLPKAVASGTPGASIAIQESERIWKSYSDAFLIAMYPAADKQAAYGSTFATNHDLELARLNWEHVAALRRLQQHYTAK